MTLKFKYSLINGCRLPGIDSLARLPLKIQIDSLDCAVAWGLDSMTISKDGPCWKRALLGRIWETDIVSKITVIPIEDLDIKCWGRIPLSLVL